MVWRRDCLTDLFACASQTAYIFDSVPDGGCAKCRGDGVRSFFLCVEGVGNDIGVRMGRVAGSEDRRVMEMKVC